MENLILTPLSRFQVKIMAEVDTEAFCTAMEEMKSSLSAARDTLRTMKEKCVYRTTTVARSCTHTTRHRQQIFDLQEGISLLTLKHHALLSYIQSLALLAAHRALGHSLGDRVIGGDGTNTSAVVNTLVKERIVLERARVLEGRMKYQIDKLVRIAQEDEATGGKGKMDALNGESLLF